MITFYISAFLLLAYLSYKYILYPAFVSPLSKVPAAHPSAHFFPLWIWYRRRQLRETRSIYDAHIATSSPVVRLAPDEVSVASLDGLKKVYGGGFDRTEWFAQFRNFDDVSNLVTMMDSKSHSTRKRILSHIYSKSYILSSKDFQVLSSVILGDRLFSLFNEVAEKNGELDVLPIVSVASTEMMSGYAFGYDNRIDLLSQGKEEERATYLRHTSEKVHNFFKAKQSIKVLEEQCLEIVRKVDATLDQEKQKSPIPPSTNPVVYRQLREFLPSREQRKTLKEIYECAASEVLDNIEASREGIGVSVAYAMYRLSKRRDAQDSLRDELKTMDPPLTYPLTPDAMSTATLRQLDSLPFLEAVVTETLRVNTAAPGLQRRSVPPGGAVIDGYFIPGGVTISSAPYIMHRHSSAFPDAEVWRPERWIGLKDVGELEERLPDDDPRKWFWAFSNGGRMCIGNHFALLVMKIILASVYANFTTGATHDSGMEQREGLIGSPVGGKVVLKFSSSK